MLRTIDDVRRANRNAGRHWFDVSTLRFFGSRIGQTLYGGRFFTSSEHTGPSSSTRAYSVRVALNQGADIETVGEFLEHSSSTTANRLAEKLAAACNAGRVEVRHDSYLEPDGSTPDREPKRTWYEWRAFVLLEDGQSVAVGFRTTHRDAHYVKRQLSGKYPTVS